MCHLPLIREFLASSSQVLKDGAWVSCASAPAGEEVESPAASCITFWRSSAPNADISLNVRYSYSMRFTECVKWSWVLSVEVFHCWVSEVRLQITFWDAFVWSRCLRVEDSLCLLSLCVFQYQSKILVLKTCLFFSYVNSTRNAGLRKAKKHWLDSEAMKLFEQVQAWGPPSGSPTGPTVTLAQLWQCMMRPLSAYKQSSESVSKVSIPPPLFPIEKQRWGISVRYRVAILKSRLAFSMNSHVNHLLGSYKVLLLLLSSAKAGDDRGVVKLLW